MDRQQRHNLKHDKFVDEIGVLSSKARENQRLLIIIGVAAVAIAIAVYGFFFWRGNREQSAQEALSVAIDTFEAQVGDTPAGQPAPTGPHFKTEQERTAAAEKLFKDVQAQYSASDAADVAGLYLARIAASRGDIAGARKGLEKFIDEHPDHILTGAARFSLYQLRIENGEAATVETELNAELAKPEPALPGDSLLVLLAQAYETQGNMAKSLEAYRRITNEYPQSPYVVEAQRRLGA